MSQELQQQKKFSKGSIAIALANIVPLIGVLLGYWSAFDIIFLYWFENIIIGLLTICRIISSPKRGSLPKSDVFFTAAFFCVHYGFFTYGHGIFLASFFGEQLMANNSLTDDTIVNITGLMLSHRDIQLTILAIFLAHVIDFILAYKDRTFDTTRKEMFKPYKRIMILHITIIFGGFVATRFENTWGIALIMIALKTYYDLNPPSFKKKKKELSSQNLSNGEPK